MTDQDELSRMNQGILEDLFDVVRLDPEGIVITPKGDHTLADLLDIPEGSTPTEHDADAFARFIISHMTYRQREDSPAYEMFSKKLDEMKNEDFSKIGWSRVKYVLDDITKNLFKYFEMDFDPSSLNSSDEKAFRKLKMDMGVKDPFMSREDGGKKRIVFRKEVKDSPNDYLSIRFDISKIYDNNREKIDRILHGYNHARTIHSHEDGKEWSGGHSDIPENAGVIPAGNMGYRPFLKHGFSSDWWRFGQIRKAMQIENRTKREYEKSLKKCGRGRGSSGPQDYRLAICLRNMDLNIKPDDRDGLIEVLRYDSLKDAVESGRYTREGLEYYNNVLKRIRKPLMREAFVTYGKWDIAENAAVAMLALMFAGYVGYKHGDDIAEFVGTVPERPSPAATVIEVPMPPVYTQEGCNDNCSAYFPEPVCGEPEPKVIIKTKTNTVYRNRPCPTCGCEGRVGK